MTLYEHDHVCPNCGEVWYCYDHGCDVDEDTDICPECQEERGDQVD